MFGGDLPSNDAFTESLITNDEVLAVNQTGRIRCGAGWHPAGRLPIGPTGRQPGCLALHRGVGGVRLRVENLPGFSRAGVGSTK
jgi:hypothetical protein